MLKLLRCAHYSSSARPGPAWAGLPKGRLQAPALCPGPAGIIPLSARNFQVKATASPSINGRAGPLGFRFANKIKILAVSSRCTNPSESVIMMPVSQLIGYQGEVSASESSESLA